MAPIEQCSVALPVEVGWGMCRETAIYSCLCRMHQALIGAVPLEDFLCPLFSYVNVNSTVQMDGKAADTLLRGTRPLGLLPTNGTVQQFYDWQLQVRFDRSAHPAGTRQGWPLLEWPIFAAWPCCHLTRNGLLESRDRHRKDGRASVTFTLPEQSTAWELLAKGITAGTQTGEADRKSRVKKISSAS